MDLTHETVPAGDGLELAVWAREPDGADEAVLFVHGVVTNGRALFATPVEGDESYSWVHAASNLGRGAFAMDQRGYGESERPPELEEPPEANDPPVRADRAAADIGAVVDRIREDYDVVHLVGVSWGSHTTGRYVGDRDAPVASLALVAPVYEPNYSVEAGLAGLGIDGYDRAWFEQDRESVRARSNHDPEVFDALWRAQVESKQGVDEETYVAQAGGIADWAASVRGETVWNPAAIDVPALVFYGSDDAIADRQGSLQCYDELGTDAAEYVEFAGVDHYPMHGDRRREVFDLVGEFQDRVGR